MAIFIGEYVAFTHAAGIGCGAVNGFMKKMKEKSPLNEPVLMSSLKGGPGPGRQGERT